MQIIKINSDSEVEAGVNKFLHFWKDGREWIIQKTSGSTGKPKNIKIPKWKMNASAEMTGSFLELQTCKSALLCISPNYIGGKMMIIRAIRYNLDLYITKVARNPLQNIDFPIDFVAMVPLQVEEILQSNPEKLNLIRTLIVGGAPVSDKLIDKLSSYKCRAFATFGMTETVSHIALKELKILNAPYRATGKASFTTEEDCLVISSEELEINNLKTNDIVQLLDKHSFYWLGRADFVINTGGVKVFPESVEKKIQAIVKEGEFIISKLPDEEYGNKVIFIGEESIKNHNLEDEINRVVDNYERPKNYFFLKELIKTESGKINRIETTKMALNDASK